MDEVVIEHRLTTIEAKLDMFFVQNLSALNGLTEKVGRQNGRISKLETGWAKLIAIVSAVMVSAPFIFYGLSRIFEGG